MRHLIAGFSFASLLFGLPIITVFGALVLSLRFRAWEVLFMGLFKDFLYAPLGGIFEIPFLATLLSIAIVWGLEPVRRKLYVF